MSINRNRARLKTAENNHQYRIIWYTDNYPPYWNEGVGYHSRRRKTSMIGSKNYSCWKRKEVLHFKYRMYRSWKHNRKTRWK